MNFFEEELATKIMIDAARKVALNQSLSPEEIEIKQLKKHIQTLESLLRRKDGGFILSKEQIRALEEGKNVPIIIPGTFPFKTLVLKSKDLLALNKED